MASGDDRRQGSLSPAAAQAMASVSGVLLKLHQVSELETRLEELEANPIQTTNNSPISTPPIDWPQPLASEAFHGLAGDVVKAIEPHTETDPAPMLVNLLGQFGNIVGA